MEGKDAREGNRPALPGYKGALPREAGTRNMLSTGEEANGEPISNIPIL